MDLSGTPTPIRPAVHSSRSPRLQFPYIKHLPIRFPYIKLFPIPCSCSSHTSNYNYIACLVYHTVLCSPIHVMAKHLVHFFGIRTIHVHIWSTFILAGTGLHHIVSLSKTAQQLLFKRIERVSRHINCSEHTWIFQERGPGEFGKMFFICLCVYLFWLSDWCPNLNHVQWRRDQQVKR